MIYLTRRERFNAAHKLYRDDWSAEKNEEVFGKCANHNWHGHNYEVFVTVKGEINPTTGFVVDLKQLSIVLQNKIVNPLDHRNINLDVPFMKGKMASTEVLAIEIWKEIKTEVEALGCQLHSVKVQETENNSVEYYG
ncbi:MAG: 6-carboxytetrahydropterin synthase [Bacteroidetes bacterium]|nr:6-carboxytetrahydropterin synthase [Bacteroidota bacterium]